MIHPLLLNARILCVVDGCFYCAKYKEVIEKINADLRFDKMIEIVDFTSFHKWGIIDNPKVRLLHPYTQGAYPVLFFEGIRKDGANSVTEIEAWLRAKLEDDFKYPQENKYIWNKECVIANRGIFKNKIVCN